MNPPSLPVTADDSVYGGGPWSLREERHEEQYLARSESLFALANGHIGLRANLDEGEPHGIPGTYLNGFYETRPLPHAEAGYGYPEDGQTIVNVTNGKIIRLLVDDEPFDLRYGTVVRHERELDMRAGVLRREVEWISPAGQGVIVRSTRLVSFVQRAVAAICFEVEPIGEGAQVVLQSELVANEPLPAQSKDPRAAAALAAPLVGEEHSCYDKRGVLVHHLRASGLRMAAGMDHEIQAPQRVDTSIEAWGDIARLTAATELKAGEVLRLTKYLSYGWSSRRSMPSVRDQVIAALAAARSTGWEGLLTGQRKYLDDYWAAADVEIDGDDELQRAVRFAQFQTLQAAARAERRGIGAKGLTGPGYDGHAFWDSETYILPVLTYTVPHAAGDAIRWRHGTLDRAKRRATELGLRGAAFPWRTISGEECSGYWPAGTAAFHLAADIAAAVERYRTMAGDDDFEREVGLEILVETARMWVSLGHHDLGMNGEFRIDGVTGPDEYSAIADNNVFTNLMAQRNLRWAAAATERHPDLSAALEVSEAEVAAWRKAADAMHVPYDDNIDIYPQASNFTHHEVWDFESTPADHYPLMLHHPYFELYRTQVIKQADLVLALYLCGDHFTAEEKTRNFAYYEAITVRDSSLSATIQSIVAAEVGHTELAYDYFAETALIDFEDLAGNTADGLHVASMAGAWLTAVAGFGGLRDHEGELSFAPRLPKALDRLAFKLQVRGRKLRVEITPDGTTYEIVAGDPLDLTADGESIRIAEGEPVTLPLAELPEMEAPEQPAGRAPLPRAELHRMHREQLAAAGAAAAESGASNG
ncbi:MAG: glycosyl hydrolase family 65 protein [Patulibacter sp.]|nr:glycosyl hydrolase family 65 protein [Patulibacter sp.]